MPTSSYCAYIGKLNQELVKAGILLAAEGLPSSPKARASVFSGQNAPVIDGPFAEPKELSRLLLWQGALHEEASNGSTAAPHPHGWRVEPKSNSASFRAMTSAPATDARLRKQEADLRAQSAPKKQ